MRGRTSRPNGPSHGGGRGGRRMLGRLRIKKYISVGKFIFSYSTSSQVWIEIPRGRDGLKCRPKVQIAQNRLRARKPQCLPDAKMSEGQPHWGGLLMNMPPQDAAAAAGIDAAEVAVAKRIRAKTIVDVCAKYKGQPSRRRRMRHCRHHCAEER